MCKLHGCNGAVYIDAKSGRIHDFCGKTHATQYQLQNSNDIIIIIILENNIIARAPIPH